MLKPSLTNFNDFIEKPKPLKPKTKTEIQKDINWYMNISLVTESHIEYELDAGR